MFVVINLRVIAVVLRTITGNMYIYLIKKYFFQSQLFFLDHK